MRLVSKELSDILPEEIRNTFGNEIPQEEIIDYLFEVSEIELRPRPYKEGFGSFLWCCEVHNWNNLGDYPKILANCQTKEEAINNALSYVFKELC